MIHVLLRYSQRLQHWYVKLPKGIQHLIWIVLLSLVLAVYGGHFFYNYLHNYIVGGWDGTNHYAVAKEFSDTVWQRLYGWLGSWNAGMVWPLGYPPFFYYLIATLDHLLPFAFITIFRWFFIVVMFGIPVAMYAISWRLYSSKIAAASVGLLSIFLLTSSNSGGITFLSTFGSGLYPQTFAVLLLLGWLFFYLRAYDSQVDYIWSIIFLSLCVVTNVHVAEFALIIFGIGWLGALLKYRTASIVWKGVLHGGLVVLLTAFWIIPLILHLSYFPTKTFSSVEFGRLLDDWFILLFPVVAVVVLFFHRIRLLSLVAWSAVVSVIMIVLPWKEWLPSLPLQPFRLYPMILFLSLLTVPFVLQWLYRLHKSIGGIAAVVIVGGLASWQLVNPLINKPYITFNEQHLIGAVQQLEGSRSLVEAFFNTRYPAHFNFASLVGIDGPHETIWNVFRESSINSPFIQPLRNTLSDNREDFGVVCYLCDYSHNQELFSQDVETRFKRARLYGIGYFLIRSDVMTKLFEIRRLVHGDIELIHEYDPWSLYSFVQQPSRVEMLTQQPILVATDLKSKDRPYQGYDAYDWLRLNEAWFMRGEFDTFFAHARSTKIEELPLEDFERLLLIEYSYDDLDTATQRLVSYAQDHEVVIATRPDTPTELEKVLQQDTEDLFTFIQRTGDVDADAARFIDSFTEVLDDSLGLATVGEYDDERVAGTIDTQGGTTYLLVKNAYFPAWEDIDGGRLYMTSPALTLLVTESDSFDLQFQQPRGVTTGSILSIVGLLGLVFYALKLKPSQLAPTTKVTIQR